MAAEGKQKGRYMAGIERLEGWRACRGEEEAYVKGFLATEAESYQRVCRIGEFISGVLGAMCLLSACCELARLKTAVRYADGKGCIQRGVVTLACILAGLLFVCIMVHMKRQKDRRYVGHILETALQVLDVRILAVYEEDTTHFLAEFCDTSGRECGYPLSLRGFDFGRDEPRGLCMDLPELKLFREQMIIPCYDAGNAWCRGLAEYWEEVRERSLGKEKKRK